MKSFEKENWVSPRSLLFGLFFLQQKVIYYLCILLKDPVEPHGISQVVPIFQSAKPRLDCLIEVYRSCQEILAHQKATSASPWVPAFRKPVLSTRDCLPETPKPQWLAYFLYFKPSSGHSLRNQYGCGGSRSPREGDWKPNLLCDIEQSINVYFSVPLVQSYLFYQLRGDLETMLGVMLTKHTLWAHLGLLLLEFIENGKRTSALLIKITFTTVQCPCIKVKKEKKQALRGLVSRKQCPRKD